MKTSHLHDQWETPDNSRLTSKQFSFRLPVHLAAKIAALCEIYPQKNRTQIVADLLTAALDDLEKNLPEALGNPLEPNVQDHYAEEAAINGESFEKLFYLGGPRARFRNVANRHYAELEQELGNETPNPLFTDIWITKSELEQNKK